MNLRAKCDIFIKMPKTVTIGKVFPFFKSSEYFTVEVVADSATLQEFITDEKFDEGEEGAALFLPCNGRFKLGRLVFIETAMNMGLVIHECVHAAMHVLRLFFDTKSIWDSEERLAIFTEYLSNQSIKILKDAKLLTGR